jgi:uncharacterized membrane protein YkvA (DUF1232 family)
MPRLSTAFQIWLRSLFDKRTPANAKILPFASLLYLLFPLDIIPDVIPFLGQMDDLTVIIVLCILAYRAIPKEVKRDIRENVIDVEPKRP